jgi:elongation factor 1 alpha-like protein
VVGSVSDDVECISPTDAKQWLFDRAKGQSSLEQFLSKNEDIQEEQEEDDEDTVFDGKQRRDSENFHLPALNDIEKTKLLSCMEEIRNIIGETYSDKRLVDAIMSNNFDFNKALDFLLNAGSRETVRTTQQPTPKPKTDAVEKGN